MFVTPAYAQASGAGAGGMDAILINFVPIILMVAVFWFFLIRPQQKRAKEHAAMLSAITRGDTIVTTGGLVGKVTRAVDNEDLEVEVAQGVKVKVVRGMVSDVRSKPEPVNDNK
jgi:preprotein translocase subunit YajC